MRTTRFLLAALLALAAPALAAAIDAPHDRSFLPNGCQDCHQLHNALGGSLTTQVTMSDACMVCHTSHGGANHRLGFPWTGTEQATLGTDGVHHRWDASVTNAAAGAVAPSDPEMAQRVIAGRLECSVCHNQHAANKPFSPTTSMNVSIAVGASATAKGNYRPPGAPAALPVGNATLTMFSANAATALPKGYKLRVLAGTRVTVSYDGGLSWFAPTTSSGAAWVPDAATPAGGPYVAGANLALEGGALVVILSTGAGVDDYWDFFVSFPMLRSPNLTGSACLSCHQERSQGHLAVESGGDGVRVFSHPIGEALNANLKGYDHPAPLDSDGGVQGVNGDTNATNDLLLGSGSAVTCLSCHAPHNADSNSLTVDPR
jgi:hypothetical protein